MPRLFSLLRSVVAPASIAGALAIAALTSAAPAHLGAADSPDEATVLAAARSANTIYQRQLQLLLIELHSPVIAQRVEAIGFLARLVDRSTVPYLLPSLASAQDPAEQAAAAVALGHIGDPVAAPALRDLLEKAPTAAAREAAFNALNQLQAVTATDDLGRAKDSDPLLTQPALTDLGTLGSEKATDILAAGLTHDRREVVREMCAIGLGRIGDRNQGLVLEDALGDADPLVRRYAAEALVKLNYTPAVPYLLLALEGNIAGGSINHCLMLLTNQDFGYDWRANELARGQAVERGFRWWTDHAADLNK